MKIAPPPPKQELQANSVSPPSRQSIGAKPTAAKPSPRIRGPRKLAADKHSKQIAVNCTEAEWEWIVNAAKSVGLKPGRFLLLSATNKQAGITRRMQLYAEVMQDRRAEAGVELLAETQTEKNSYAH